MRITGFIGKNATVKELASEFFMRLKTLKNARKLAKQYGEQIGGINMYGETAFKNGGVTTTVNVNTGKVSSIMSTSNGATGKPIHTSKVLFSDGEPIGYYDCRMATNYTRVTKVGSDGEIEKRVLNLDKLNQDGTLDGTLCITKFGKGLEPTVTNTPITGQHTFTVC